MRRKINTLCIIAFALSIADTVFTIIGVRSGYLEEANPFLSNAVMNRPELMSILACIYTGIIIFAIGKYGAKAKTAKPLLILLVLIKAAVITAHVSYLFMHYWKAL